MTDGQQAIAFLVGVVVAISVGSWVLDKMDGHWGGLGKLMISSHLWFGLGGYGLGLYLIVANSDGLLWLGVVLIIGINIHYTTHNAREDLKRLEMEHRRDFLMFNEVTIRIREEVLSALYYVDRPYRDNERLDEARAELKEFTKEVREYNERQATYRLFPVPAKDED